MKDDGFQYASQCEQALHLYQPRTKHVDCVTMLKWWGTDSKSAGHTARKPNAAMSFGECDLQEARKTSISPVRDKAE